MTLTEKIRNTRMLGLEGNPFYLGAYHMKDGKPVIGLGGKARPNIDGLAQDKFNPYKGGMNNATLMAMQPTPTAHPDGRFKEGSMEGLFNFYDNEPYDLMLWVQDLSVRYSGGRGFRFTQSTGGRARGLYMQNCYSQGTMKQWVHLAGVYDFIIKGARVTLSGVEFNYWDPPSNRQAALATKGTEGDPDTPCNGWFDDPLIWQGWSSESVNSNSGNRGAGVLDGFAVDSGLYCYYDDRTPDMGLQRCIAIRTDSEAFKDYTSGEHGRGLVAFSVQNEEHDGSFDWTGTYNTPEDFAKYRTHDSVLEQCIAIGYAHSFGFQSQCSTKQGKVHEGAPHGAGVYWYGCLSVNPVESHWLLKTGNNDDAYNLDKDNPPRVWGNAHVGAAPVADRNEPQFATVFVGNYFDEDPPATYGLEAVVGGMSWPVSQYEDLSVLMETDPKGWMNESQALNFRDKVRELCRPVLADHSSIRTTEVDYPEGYTLSDFEPLDIEGKPWGDTMPLGPHAENTEDPDTPATRTTWKPGCPTWKRT